MWTNSYPRGAAALAQVLRVAFSKSGWDGPASNDPVTITFSQHIGANDALRTGSYAKTLTFTLSATQPQAPQRTDRCTQPRPTSSASSMAG